MVKKPTRSPRSTTQSRDGGVDITGGTVSTGGGSIVGRDQIVQASSQDIDDAFSPITNAIKDGPPDKRDEALAKLEELKKEVTTEGGGDDRAVAGLLDGLVALIPSAASAIAGAFATPILGAIAGPVTGYVIDKLKGK